MKQRFLLILMLSAAGIGLASWGWQRAIFGQDAVNRTYDSPAGQFTLPTVEGTAGTLDTDYKLAQLAFGFPSNVIQIGDLAGDTGNGFSDRYNFENLNVFNLTQAASNVGDRDTLDPANAVLVGGRLINPGFRFVHIGEQPFVWRVGAASDNQQAQEVTVFPSVDHLFDPEIPGYGPNAPNPPTGGFGNIVLEAAEFTVWGTNDAAEAQVAAMTKGYFGTNGTGVLPANGKWFRATLTKVFAEGFKDFNGKSPFSSDASGASLQEGDDFASQWQFRDASGNPVAVKYVAIYANRTRDARFFQPDASGKVPGNLARSNEAEIDAVAFKPFGAPPQLASISGRVIFDVNANGKVDAGEPPLANVTVALSGAATAATLTNAQGEFSFTNLQPGNYRLIETNLPTYIDSGAIAGPGNTVVDANIIAATLAAGQNSTDNIFLDTQPPVTDRCVPACFNNPDMWLVNDAARRAAINAAGLGNIFILSLNRPAASEAEILTALDDFGSFKAALNREFVGAQLNAASYPGSIFNRASCFYLGRNVYIQIPGDPRLIDLLNQARTAFANNDTLAIRTLTAYLTNFNNITSTVGILCPFVDP